MRLDLIGVNPAVFLYLSAKLSNLAGNLFAANIFA
jgi:hypothetical protein